MICTYVKKDGLVVRLASHTKGILDEMTEKYLKDAWESASPQEWDIQMGEHFKKKASGA